MMLATYLYLVLTLRVTGALLSLPLYVFIACVGKPLYFAFHILQRVTAIFMDIQCPENSVQYIMQKDCVVSIYTCDSQASLPQLIPQHKWPLIMPFFVK